MIPPGKTEDIAQMIENAANEIISQWDNLILPNGKTLHEDLVKHAETKDSIYPENVLFNTDMKKIGIKHMGELNFAVNGWAIASAVYNVASGLPIRGGRLQ